MKSPEVQKWTSRCQKLLCMKKPGGFTQDTLKWLPSGMFMHLSNWPLKVVGHSHSFLVEDDLSRRSIQAFQNDTIIISWLFSFRVIQPTEQWHTFKTFMFVFINSCSSQKLFVKYLTNIDLIWLSVTRYKPKLSHGQTCYFMLDRLHWCAKQRNRTSVLLGELWYTYKSIWY